MEIGGAALLMNFTCSCLSRLSNHFILTPRFGSRLKMPFFPAAHRYNHATNGTFLRRLKANHESKMWSSERGYNTIKGLNQSECHSLGDEQTSLGCAFQDPRTSFTHKPTFAPQNHQHLRPTPFRYDYGETHGQHGQPSPGDQQPLHPNYVSWPEQSARQEERWQGVIANNRQYEWNSARAEGNWDQRADSPQADTRSKTEAAKTEGYEEQYWTGGQQLYEQSQWHFRPPQPYQPSVRSSFDEYWLMQQLAAIEQQQFDVAKNVQPTQSSRFNPSAANFASPHAPRGLVAKAFEGQTYRINKANRYQAHHSRHPTANTRRFDTNSILTPAVQPVLSQAQGIAGAPSTWYVNPANGVKSQGAQIPKAARHNFQNNQSKNTTPLNEAGGVQLPFRRSQRLLNQRSTKNPTNFSLSPKRPEPKDIYLKVSREEPTTIHKPRPLLVVLDLNGTLLYRKNKGANFLPRPMVDRFLKYLLNNHKVMVWSSARPDNVKNMCKKLFDDAESPKLAGVWARDKLRLSPAQYNDKVQVYKQLSWIWDNAEMQRSSTTLDDFWSQANTVLIDDSVEKAASEPFNLIRVEDFEGTKEQMTTDVLGQVVQYLETLSSQRDVSAYIRQSPFSYDVSATPFDWTTVSS